MQVSIITGASRGLGRAVAAQLLQRGHRVLSIARNAPDLASSPGELQVWTSDLADAAPLAQRLTPWLRAQRDAAALTLIANAGVLSAPGPVADTDAADLVRALRVGLESAVLLTASFLAATASLTVPRRIVLVSSGLGRRAMAGSAAYCAAKAGMDHFARAVTLEQATLPHGARIVSLAPGVIDTDMQQQLRGADAQRFPERERFQGLHAGGHLDTPEQAATRLLRYLDRDDFGAQPVGDVRDA